MHQSVDEDGVGFYKDSPISARIDTTANMVADNFFGELFIGRTVRRCLLSIPNWLQLAWTHKLSELTTGLNVTVLRWLLLQPYYCCC